MSFLPNYFSKLAYILSTMVPNTNPEIFNWVFHQREGGKSLEEIKTGLVNAGWSQEMADTIILYAREDSQFSYKAPEEKPQEKVNNSMNSTYDGSIEKNKIKKADNMPGIIFDNFPNTYDVGDKIVNLVVSIDHPRVLVFDNFLSDDECAQVIKISENKLQRSTTMGDLGTNSYDIPQSSEVRTSTGTFLRKNEDNILPIIDKRIEKLFNWNTEKYGEDLQILKYKPGQEYKPHHDYFEKSFIEKERKKTNWGQRVGTVLLYLNHVEEGGQTIFPETGINVHPKKGTALFFSYQDDDSSLSLHGGSPVITGVKWVATKWLRSK